MYWEKRFTPNNYQLSTNLQTGIYFLKIDDGKNIATHKISVVK